MEVAKEIQREYDPAHPNYERWRSARDVSNQRAEFVKNVISEKIVLENLMILDIGAGEGITSMLLSDKNFVVSLEPKSERIKKIPATLSLNPIRADSLNFPFRNSVFNLIILQDVVEHLNITENFIEELKNILKEDGIIYISTPNKFSLFNIVSDPHWGMPFLSLFRRDHVRRFFLKYFRKNDYHRDDIAELLSLKNLINLFEENFAINLCTKFSVEYLLNGGKGLVWSKFHLRLVKFVNSFDLAKFLRRIANNKIGIINNFITPTFYVIMKKK